MKENPFAKRSEHPALALKVPPNSVEAEQSVIGSILLSNNAWEKVADLLVPTDFYRPEHRVLYESICELAEKNQPFDAVTLSDWLKNKGILDQVGGLAYIGILVKETPSAANVRAYAELVHERSVMRRLAEAGNAIADRAYVPEGMSAPEMLDEAESHLHSIRDEYSHKDKRSIKMRDHVASAFEKIDQLYHGKNPITGVPTGYAEFDKMTAGLQPSDLVVIAGRPSMGKTSFAMNLAEHAAIKYKIPTLVFSMEMSSQSLAMRMISSLGRIDQHRVRTGALDEQDWPRLVSAMEILSNTQLLIDDTGALTPMELRARARRAQKDHKIGIIVIDYLQLMRGSGRTENRVQEISDITRSLKALAKELNVPVLALSQLNRSLEQRPNKRPIMSDLRDSGTIEQDADLVVFIYRDDVYNENSPDKGVAEIIIGKQRNGPTGTVRLNFLGKYTRFENCTTIARPAFNTEH